jgi:cysteine desulfuration protein SufE
MNHITYFANPVPTWQEGNIFLFPLYSLLLPGKSQYFVNMKQMQTLSDIQETFSLLAEWEDKYAYLIDLGRNLPEFPESQKNEDTLVKGCTSRVWMILKDIHGKIDIKADSDAHIVKGLIALVIAAYQGVDCSEISAIDMDKIFKDLGLTEQLSPNRRNGFFSMVEKIKKFNSN